MSAVDRGIKQLSGTSGPTENSVGSLKAPGQYAMPARTREDVIQTTPNIQDVPSDNLTAAPDVVERAMAADSNDMFALLAGVSDPAGRQLGHGIPGQAQPMPMREAPVSPGGLIMPNGAPPHRAAPAPAPAPADSGWLM